MSLFYRITILPLLIALFAPHLLSAQSWQQMCAENADIAVPDENTVLITGTTSAQMVAAGPILRSDDGGHTWRLLESGTRYGIRHVAFFTSRLGLGRVLDGSVCRTIDGGESWDTVLRPARQMRSLWESLMVTSGDTALVVMGDSTMMRTIDRGTTWESVTVDSLGFGSFHDGVRLRMRGSTAYLQTLFFLARSDDGGKNWRRQSLPDSMTSGAVHIVDSATVLLLGNDGRLYRTDDAGTTWRVVYRDSTGSSSVRIVSLPDGSIARLWQKYNPNAPEPQLAVSRDTGATWSLHSIPPPTINTQTVSLIAPVGEGVICAGTSGTVYKWDGATELWDTVSHFPCLRLGGFGYGGLVLGPLHVASSGRWGVLGAESATADRVFYVTDDTGATWRPAGARYQNRFVGASFADALNGVALHPGGWLSTTSDGGLTWGDTVRPLGVPDSTIGGEGWQGVEFAPGGTVGAVWNNNSLYRTADAGATWSAVPLDAALDSVSKIIFLDPLNAVMVGAAPGSATPEAANAEPNQWLYSSNDGGATWSRVYPNDPASAPRYRNIWVWNAHKGEVTMMAEVNRNVVPEGFYAPRQLLRSYDLGRSWGVIEAADSLLRFSKVEYYNESEAWAVGDGIHHSSDGGATWQRESLANLGDIYDGSNLVAEGRGISHLALTPDRRRLIAYTASSGGQGFFLQKRLTSPILPAAVRRERQEVAAAQLRVLGGVAEDQRVVEVASEARGELSLIDGRGRSVRALPAVESGTARVPLNLAGLPSGSYTVVYRSASGVASAPVVVVR